MVLKQAKIIALSLMILMVLSSAVFAAADSDQYLTASHLQAFWPAVGQGVGYMRFEHLTVSEGLSENTVLTIFQDRHGFMWFGTREGLNKYDGYDFTIYKANLDDPAALSDAYVTTAIESQDGSIWLGTYYGGLNRFDQEVDRFERFMPKPGDPTSLPDENVQALFEDSWGRLWVGTEGGLSLLNEEGTGFTTFEHDPTETGSLSDNDVQVIFEDSSGSIWIGTQNGLNRFDTEALTFERFFVRENADYSNIKSICLDGDTGLWLGTYGGLIRFNIKTKTFRLFTHDAYDPDSISSNLINVIYRDRSGDLWLGFEDAGVNRVIETDAGKVRLDKYISQPYDPNSLSNNTVHAIYEDRGGVMWFGTFGGGINKAALETQAFGLYKRVPDDPNSPAGDRITALAFDLAAESLWVGTAENGLDQLDLMTGRFIHYRHNAALEDSLADDHVTALHVDQAGRLWIGLRDEVLQYFDPSTESFLMVPERLFPRPVSSGPVDIAHDAGGDLWVAFGSGEVVRLSAALDAASWYLIESADTQSDGNVLLLSLYPDENGNIWLGTENQGLIRFDPQMGTYQTYEKGQGTKGPSHNSITNIYEDQNGIFWLGTSGGGLNRFDPEEGVFTAYTTQDGLPSNRIFGIVRDEYGFLWLSTGNGLARFNPITTIVRTYDVRDGLQGNTFNIHAHTVSDDGALFFGGVNGFNAFYPRLITDNEKVPPIVITSVSLFNDVLRKDISSCTQSLTLRFDQNFLSFEFAALDYTAPGKNQYAYILEGINEDYVDAGSRRYADYPNLPWGDYTFRVIGSNNDGVWNTSGACLQIHIKPPFWATWWFITLVAVLLAASVVVGYRLRLRTIESQRQRLAVTVFQRTQEIERRRQIAEGLSQVVRLLNTNQPLDESLSFIVKQAVGLTSASKAVIFERLNHQIIVRASYPEGPTFALDLEDSESSSARALMESIFLKRYLIYSRVNPKTLKSDSHWELVTGEYRTVICMPLLLEDTVYGGLVMYYGEERTFTPDEIKLAHTLADQASLAIANQYLKARVQDVAVAAERNRLARELHDAVTQTLFSSSLIAEVLPKLYKKHPQEAEKRLHELQQLSRGALAEMRTLLMELRPSALRDADPIELFKHLVNAFTGRTGVPVAFEIAAPPVFEIPEDVKSVFYRIAQEALNNIFKHAEAEQVWFSFAERSNDIILTIRDDGVGFDEETITSDHLGLEIMYERAESISANLTITSQPGQGTTLTLVWCPDESEEQAV